jgi:hypothetical protein
MALNTPNFYHPMFGGKYGDDPLGIALQDRAAQARQQQHMDEMEGDINHRMIGGPLPSAAWDGLLQAMAERGVRRVGASSGTAALGPTYDPGYQTSAVDQANSNNIASPYHGQSLDRRATATRQLLPGYGGPMEGLQGAAPYQTHEQWMAENKPRVAPGLEQPEPPGVGQWAVRKSTTPGGGYRRSSHLQVENSPLNQFQRYQRPNPNE